MEISDVAGKDRPITVNEKGGGQSSVPVRFDLIDGKALFNMAHVLDEGAKKYGDNNWRQIDVEDHLNHLIMHAYAYLSGDRSDEHLSHIMCRAMFAQAVAITEAESKTYIDNPDYAELVRKATEAIKNDVKTGLVVECDTGRMPIWREEPLSSFKTLLKEQLYEVAGFPITTDSGAPKDLVIIMLPDGAQEIWKLQEDGTYVKMKDEKKTFKFVRPVEQEFTHWTIPHQMNCNPSVVLLDKDNLDVSVAASMRFKDINTIEIGPTSAVTAILSKE